MEAIVFNGDIAHIAGGATPPSLDSSWITEQINTLMDQVDRRHCRIHQARASQPVFDWTEFGSSRPVSLFS